MTLTRRRFIAGVGAAALVLGKERFAVAAEPRWVDEQYKVPEGENFNVNADDTHRSLVVWDGKDVNSLRVLVVAQGNKVEIPGAVEGKMYRTYNDWATNVVAKSRVMARNEKVQAKLPEDHQVPVVVVGVEGAESAPVPAGWVVNGAKVEGVGAVASQEAAGPTKWTEQPKQFKATKPEDTLGSVDKYTIASIWDGKNPENRIVVILDKGVLVQNLGTTEGSVWEAEGDFGVVQAEAGVLAQNVQKGDPKLAHLPVPTTVIMPGEKKDLLGDWKFASNSRKPEVKQAELNPFKGQAPKWEEQTESLAVAHNTERVIGSDQFEIVQMWDGSNPNSTVQVLVGPNKKLTLKGPWIGTKWRVKGDLEQVSVQVIGMAVKKDGIKTYWGHIGDPMGGYTQLPEGWKLE